MTIDKVVEFEPKIDWEFDRIYLPICEYSGHIGVVLNDEKCIRRRCRWYGRYYFESKSIHDRPRRQD